MVSSQNRYIRLTTKNHHDIHALADFSPPRVLPAALIVSLVDRHPVSRCTRRFAPATWAG